MLQAAIAPKLPFIALVPVYRPDAYQLETVLFRKTIAGHNEIAHRHAMLRAEQRRLLILMDGRHSIEELQPCFRTNELPKLIDELLNLGFIEPVSTSSSSFKQPSMSEAVGSTRSLPPAQFEAARRAALHAVTELLGTESRSHLVRLEKCRDSADLRIVLDEVQEKLRDRLGEDAATLFLESVRDAASLGKR